MPGENKTVEWFGKRNHAPVENSIRELPKTTRQVYAKPTTFSDISIRREILGVHHSLTKVERDGRCSVFQKSIFGCLGILLSA